MNELTAGLIGVAWVIGALVTATLWIKRERSQDRLCDDLDTGMMTLLCFLAWPCNVIGWSILRIVKELEKREK